MKLAPLLLTLAQLLTGCTAEPSEPPHSSTTVYALTATLQNSTGESARVSLRAENQTVYTVGASSCSGEAGATMQRGDYRFYLEGADGRSTDQDLHPFGDTFLEFNAQRPGMFEVILGKMGEQPDLLIIRQYASCNGQLTAVLKLSTDAGQLQVVRFQTADGEKEHLFVSRLESLGNGMVRTSSYDNATGKQTDVTWKLDEGAATFVSVPVY